MTHENDSMDSGERGGVGSARSAFAVGQHFVAASNGEQIQLTQVTRDFIHWINPTTGSTGRMMRCHFLNFFTPIS